MEQIPRQLPTHRQSINGLFISRFLLIHRIRRFAIGDNGGLPDRSQSGLAAAHEAVGEAEVAVVVR